MWPSWPTGSPSRAVTTVAERTGVEMEALTACAAAALVLVQALLDVDPCASVEDLTLWHKSGGGRGCGSARPVAGRGSDSNPRRRRRQFRENPQMQEKST